MKRYLLDTNAISEMVRHPNGPVDLKLRSNIAEDIGTSIVVKGEILFGLQKNGSVRGRERLDIILGTIRVWTLENPADEIYGYIRNQIRLLGQSVDPNDLWIAAHALALNAILVTDNEKHFRHVPGLKIENWLR